MRINILLLLYLFTERDKVKFSNVLHVKIIDESLPEDLTLYGCFYLWIFKSYEYCRFFLQQSCGLINWDHVDASIAGGMSVPGSSISQWIPCLVESEKFSTRRSISLPGEPDLHGFVIRGEHGHPDCEVPQLARGDILRKTDRGGQYISRIS